MNCKCSELSLEERRPGLPPTGPQARPWQIPNGFVPAELRDFVNESLLYTVSSAGQSSDNANTTGLELSRFDHEQTGNLNAALFCQVDEDRSQEPFQNPPSNPGLSENGGSISLTFLDSFDTTDSSLPSEPYEPGQSERTCYLCDKVFRYPKDFRRHWKGAHELRRPHKCPFATCTYFTKGFVRKDHKERHMRKLHPEYIAGARQERNE